MKKIFILSVLSLLMVGCASDKKYLIIKRSSPKSELSEHEKLLLQYPYSCKFVSEEEYKVNAKLNCNE